MRDLVWTRRGRRLLDVPRLDLRGPGLVVVTGPSGAGKSSLLKALTGTLQDFQGGNVAGSVRLEASGGARALVGFVPQDARDSYLAHDPLTEIQLRLQSMGWEYKAAREEAHRQLDSVGLAARAHLPVHRLSAGERRRLALFAARVHRPDLVLLDEPLNHLDATWRSVVRRDVSSVAERSLVVVSTHEPQPWEETATQRVHVENGRASERAATPPAATSWTRDPIPPGESWLVATGIQAPRGLFTVAELRLGRGLHGIAGSNGSGKSTLLRLLGGLEAPEAGTVRFQGHDVHDLSPADLARFRVHHIEEPRETFFLDRSADEIAFQPRNARLPKHVVEQRVHAASDAFGLDALAHRHPLSLSGGEQERLALACTHAAGAHLLLLDEPTQGLDGQGRTTLLRYLAEASRGACVVLATHDEKLLERCDTVHTIEAGTLREIHSSETETRVEVSLRAR